MSTRDQTENDDDGRKKAHNASLGPGRMSLLCAVLRFR